MTCRITGTAGLLDGTVFISAQFRFRRTPTAVVAQDSRVISPQPVLVQSNSSGAVDFTLEPGAYIGSDLATNVPFPFLVPDQTTALFHDCLSAATVIPWPDAVQAAIEARDSALSSADASAASAAGAATTLAAHSTFGLMLDGSADANTARTTLERQDFATRADFVTWATGKTPAVGLVMRAAGLPYRYIGRGTAISDLPDWVPDNQVFAEHFGATSVLTQDAADTAPGAGAAFQAAQDYKTANNMAGPIYCMGNAFNIDQTVTLNGVSCGIIGVGMLETVLVITQTTGEGLRFTRSNPIFKRAKCIAGTTRAALSFNAALCGIRLECEDVADNANLRLLQADFTNFTVSGHPSHGIVAVGAVSGMFTNYNVSNNKGHGFHIAKDVYARTNATAVPGLCIIGYGIATTNGGHAVCNEPLTNIASPAVRILIINNELTRNATDAAVRKWPSQLYLRGAQIEVRQNIMEAATTNTDVEGFYASGINIIIDNNRYSYLKRAGTVSSHAVLQTQNVTVSNVHMFNHIGNYAPLVQTRIETGASEPFGVKVEKYTGGTVTALVASDGSYTPTFDGSLFPFYDNVDSTKNFRFQLSGITPGNTRTLTIPDASGAIALLSGVAQTFQNSVTCSTTFNANGSISTLGSNNGPSTVGVGTGTTTSGSTKAINIGTGGASGSTTTMLMGSTTSGAASSLTIYADLFRKMAAPASYGGAATLTNASLQTTIISYTGGTAALTLPTGTTLDSLFTTDNTALEFSIINTGTGVATVTENTGVTISGAAAVAVGTSALWALRRTAATTYIAYRKS